jgi:putative nucleotidyltransferase with HDIG domain
VTALPELTAHAVAAKIRDLPTLPAVVGELLLTIDRDDVDIKTLADKISSDQALAAKTLRLSNSSFYGMPRKITTIGQAISILGFKSVRTLVTAAGITGSFSAPESFDLESFWKHALATAALAKATAHRRHVSEEHAFLCGLLHDIGILVMAAGFPQHYAAVAAYRAEHDSYVHEAERAVLSMDHGLIGRALAEHWKFPALIQNVISDHHVDIPETDLLAAVSHVADVMAHALDFAGGENDLVPPLSEKAWAALALKENEVQDIFSEAESHFAEICRILVQ